MSNKKQAEIFLEKKMTNEKNIKSNSVVFITTQNLLKDLNIDRN